MPTRPITSLSPTDIGAKVSWQVSPNERSVGTIAAFNDSNVIVRLKDGSTLPIAWHLLELVAVEKSGLTAAVTSALASLATAGVPAKAIDANNIDVAGILEWNAAAGTWKFYADRKMRPGTLSVVIAAAKAGWGENGEAAAAPRPTLAEAIDGAPLARAGCTYARCPQPLECRERCVCPARVPAA